MLFEYCTPNDVHYMYVRSVVYCLPALKKLYRTCAVHFPSDPYCSFKKYLIRKIQRPLFAYIYIQWNLSTLNTHREWKSVQCTQVFNVSRFG